ncbi:hypothetical protein K435DRAFT_959959 [Dendrothele bispora CBS 962.96]|uniref:IMD domain-containing protein n=1 Tax=Dendrothele bispora (strain CBS 962.96) TaxID=1314807 RepID=A0A4S8MVQ0_DENBC|nr:hypothetical protein K435DRAFT_959959 [Dendrothele bispora CBS 962.96]
MATPSSLPLAERVDVHKACKSIETLLSVLNDYCEAAGAVVTLQKKLAKALRETAGMKITEEIPANTLNASANIFEALCDVDTKFAKIADKEYDAISSEVKKWFKKLAKEEKVHDDKIATANAKIKQAGQIYEKKSKKSARDASDEHARYINLISAMGPEISQEKYNHSLLVTQKHSATTFSLAACVARIADAEWLRACEGVRRHSPTVGKLGEWRALCEGGWNAPVPPDLPDVDYAPPSPVDVDHDATLRNVAQSPNQKEALQPIVNQMNNFSMDQNESQAVSPLPSPSQPPPRDPLQSQTQAEIKPPSFPPTSFDLPRKWSDENNGSVRSLSAFPAPPTHFPLPPAMTQRQKIQQPSQSPSTSSSASHVSFPSPNVRFAEPATVVREKQPEQEEAPSSPSKVSKPEERDSEKSSLEEGSNAPQPVVKQASSPRPSSPVVRRSAPSRSQTMEEAFESAERAVSTVGQVNTVADSEPLSKRVDSDRSESAGSKDIDRSGSNGSVVAAMRDRYSRNSGASSPPPREVPRLPLSVNDLATRYDRPASPRSPNGSRPLPSIDSYRQADASRRDSSSPPGAYRSPQQTALSPNITPTPEDESAARRRRQQHVDKMAELEIREKEQALRIREQEIQMRATELERERMNLLNISRSPNDNGFSPARTHSPVAEEPDDPPLNPRERRLSFQQQQPSPPVVRPRVHSQYSASATHLAPPRSASRIGENEDSDYGRRSPSRDPSFGSTSNHAAYCECDACTASKRSYNSSLSSSQGMNAKEKEKTKGWMRRLSMPIVAGFEKKSNQGISNNSYSGKSGLLSLDSKRNSSSTALGRNGVTEDGRIGMGQARRSYDASMASSRSMTNIGITRQH